MKKGNASYLLLIIRLKEKLNVDLNIGLILIKLVYLMFGEYKKINRILIK